MLISSGSDVLITGTLMVDLHSMKLQTVLIDKFEHITQTYTQNCGLLGVSQGRSPVAYPKHSEHHPVLLLPVGEAELGEYPHKAMKLCLQICLINNTCITDNNYWKTTGIQ